MKTPRFSVVIPTLNEEKFLPNLLTSLVKQTWKDFEVIVVDGQSRDTTVQTAKRFGRRLPLTVLPEKQGVSRQRNTGAKMARGDWLVFMDADSVLLPQFFERIDGFIRTKGSRFFTTWLKSDGDEPADAIAGFLLNMGIEGGVLIEKPWAPGPMTIVRRDVFEGVGGYNEAVTYGEDHELGVVIFKKGVSFDILREILYIHSFRRYRKEGSLTMLHRGLKSTLKIIFTHTGYRYMPGFVGGGSIFHESGRTRKKGKMFFKRLEKRIDAFIRELQSL